LPPPPTPRGTGCSRSQEYNICFTTITRPTQDEDGNTPLAELPSPTVQAGVLPRLIGNLVARRREVKAIIKAEHDEARRAQLDIRQKALKIMANSMYGCLGFSGSRFYARALAELITARGRDALQHACEMAENQHMEVIYGDTDSVMIHSATDDLAVARKMADTLKREVNKHYKCMEIDIDGVMKSMLLLKKKKYAALMIEEKNGETTLTRETKGLDLVRRDWCTLSREAGSKVLDFILSGKPREEIVSDIQAFLREIASKIKNNALGIEQYVVTKALTKAPGDYPDAKNQPHVQVAKAMMEQGTPIGAGTVVEYVICVDTGKAGVADRAYHPKTVLKAEGLLQIDTQWYLAQQLHPPIWRLCEPIDGIDSAQIAECLGLDPAKFQVHTDRNDDATAGHIALPSASELQRFQGADSLQVQCSTCHASGPVLGLLNHGGNSPAPVVEWLGGGALKCGTCSVKHDTERLRNALALAIRKQVKAYYTAGLRCEEVSCRDQSRGLSTHEASSDAGAAPFPPCTVPRCKGRMLKLHSDQKLHTQLLFYKTLFDLTWARKKAMNASKRKSDAQPILPHEPLAEDVERLANLEKQAAGALRASAFQNVELGHFFPSPV
jgi:DNA polymerase alpha subunit A